MAAATISIGDLSREAKAAKEDLSGPSESLVTGLQDAEEASVSFIDTVKDLPSYVSQSVNSIGAIGVLGGDFLRSGVDLGRNYSEAFAAGFATSGPGGVSTVLPMTIVGGLGLPSMGKSFADSGLIISEGLYARMGLAP